jgi:hypothetical protein
VEAGDTVRTLSRGYIINTDCATQSGVKLEDLREWKRKQAEVWNNNNKK